MAVLAGFAHERQGAACTEHNHREDNQQGGFHGEPRYGPLDATNLLNLIVVQMNRR
jgi:hypothetical protein